MAGYQQLIIVGNIGNVKDLTYTSSGDAVLNFSVAVNEVWITNGEKREKVTWFNVALWRKVAEALKPYITPGTQIMVTGTVSARAYTNNAGEAAASLDLTARDVQLLGNRQQVEDLAF